MNYITHYYRGHYTSLHYTLFIFLADAIKLVTALLLFFNEIGGFEEFSNSWSAIAGAVLDLGSGSDSLVLPEDEVFDHCKHIGFSLCLNVRELKRLSWSDIHEFPVRKLKGKDILRELR